MRVDREEPYDLAGRPPRVFQRTVLEEPSSPSVDQIRRTLVDCNWKTAAEFVRVIFARALDAEAKLKGIQARHAEEIRRYRERLEQYEPAIPEHCPKAPAESSD